MKGLPSFWTSDAPTAGSGRRAQSGHSRRSASVTGGTRRRSHRAGSTHVAGQSGRSRVAAGAAGAPAPSATAAAATSAGRRGSVAPAAATCRSSAGSMVREGARGCAGLRCAACGECVGLRAELSRPATCTLSLSLWPCLCRPVPRRRSALQPTNVGLCVGADGSVGGRCCARQPAPPRMHACSSAPLQRRRRCGPCLTRRCAFVLHCLLAVGLDEDADGEAYLWEAPEETVHEGGGAGCAAPSATPASALRITARAPAPGLVLGPARLAASCLHLDCSAPPTPVLPCPSDCHPTAGPAGGRAAG